MDGIERASLIADRGRPTTFHRGDILLHEGTAGDHCFGIVTGEVLVTTSSTTGSTVVLGRRGPGEIVGQLSLLDSAPRSARVVAREMVDARRFTRDELEQLLLDHSEFALAEIRRLAAEVRSLSRRITGRSEELRVRVVDLLQIHVESTGDPVFRSTRDELAGWVGATREAVTRTLGDLADDGIVRLGRGQVELLG